MSEPALIYNLVPPLAGVGSALGFFTAPVAFDLTRSHRVTLKDADFHEIENLFKELEEEGAAILQQAGKDKAVIFERTLMMRFVGQGAETDLRLEQKSINQLDRAHIREIFDQVYLFSVGGLRLICRTEMSAPGNSS